MFSLENITGILNSKSYDDSGWVTLAWIRAYELTGRREYLERAEQFWLQVMDQAWDNKCGGGLYWAGDTAGGGLRYKNAITNELFIMSSMRLHAHANSSASAALYLSWARKTWQWLRSSGMILENGSYVAGGLDGQCR